MLNDTIKTIKAQLYERASSPLLSTFLISWVIWNHRFIAVMISSMTITDKYSYIDSHFFTTFWGIVIMPVVGPLVTGLAMIYLYPIPAKKVYEHWRKKQRELKEIQQKIDDESPLPKEEARQIRREAFEIETKFEQERDRWSKENSRLRDVIADLQKPKSTVNLIVGDNEGPLQGAASMLTLEREERDRKESDLKKELDALRSKVATYEAALHNELTQEQDNLLVTIVQHGNINVYQMNPGPNKVKAEYNIDVLRSKNLVTGGTDKIVLTENGRKYLIGKKLIK